jgi:hypothetical protein
MEPQRTSTKLDIFLSACAGFRAVAKPEYDPETGEIIVSKGNKQIADLARKIAELEAERNDLVKNQELMRPRIGLVVKANQVLARLVAARNSAALDVMGVFSELRIPKDVFDSINVSGDVSADKLRAYKSAIDSFTGFVTTKGYTFIGATNVDKTGISNGDILAILHGVRAGRFLAKEYGLKSVVGVLKELGQADHDVENLNRQITELNQEQDRLAESNRPKNIDLSIPATQIVEKKQGDVKNAALLSQKIESELTGLSSRIRIYKALKGLTTDQTVTKVKELTRELTGIREQYQMLVVQQKLLKRADPTSKNQKVFSLQQQSLERKRSEKLIQLQGRYARLDPVEAKKKIKLELAAWEKVQKQHIDELNRETGRIGKSSDKPVQDLDAVSKQLVEMFEKIQDLDDVLKIMRTASKLTADERSGQVSKLAGLMAVKKQELQNQARKVERRKKALDLELDQDTWTDRIEEKMDNAKFVKDASRQVPINYWYEALDAGADIRTRDALRIVWSHWKLNRNYKPTKTLKRPLKFTNLHFGKAGFVVDQRYLKRNPELVATLRTALIQALADITPTQLNLIVYPALMDALKKTPDALSAHKAAFNHFIGLVELKLKSPKTKAIVEDIVEELVAAGKIATPTGANPTKKFLDQVATDLLSIVRESHAIKHLAAFTWPSYREAVLSWVRNQFRVTEKKSVPHIPSSLVAVKPATKKARV